MLRRSFLRLLAALPALPFVGRAKGGYRLYDTSAKPLEISGTCRVRGGSYTLTDAGDPSSFTTYVWSESRQAFVRQS